MVGSSPGGVKGARIRRWSPGLALEWLLDRLLPLAPLALLERVSREGKVDDGTHSRTRSVPASWVRLLSSPPGPANPARSLVAGKTRMEFPQQDPEIDLPATSSPQRRPGKVIGTGRQVVTRSRCCSIPRLKTASPPRNFPSSARTRGLLRSINLPACSFTRSDGHMWEPWWMDSTATGGV